MTTDKNPATGTDTVGSSEAVLLGGLALKRRWQERRKNAGLDTSKPNIVMGTETHVVRDRTWYACNILPASISLSVVASYCKLLARCAHAMSWQFACIYNYYRAVQWKAEQAVQLHSILPVLEHFLSTTDCSSSGQLR